MPDARFRDADGGPLRLMALDGPEDLPAFVAAEEIGKVRSRMTRKDRLYVYKQDACRRCGTPIRRWDLAGRWAYACESCQPPPS